MTPTPTLTTGFDDIDAAIASLQALAAWRTAHPEIGLYRSSTGSTWLVDPGTEATCEAAMIVRAVADGAPIGTVTKHAVGDDALFVTRDFGNGVFLTFIADREEVCTRRVVGTETVQVPDPDAPLVTVEREIVEWDCAPILAKAAG